MQKKIEDRRKKKTPSGNVVFVFVLLVVLLLVQKPCFLSQEQATNRNCLYDFEESNKSLYCKLMTI